MGTQYLRQLPAMNVAKPITAICLAAALAAPSAALAGPAGSEYLPQVPKSPSHSSKGSSSGSHGESSTGSSGSSSTLSEPTTSNSSTSETGSGAQKKQPPAKQSVKEPKPPHVKIAPLNVAPASADTGSGGDLLPIALLLFGSAGVLLAGLILRRHYIKQLQAE